jgi:hypothetical protein
MMKEGLLWYDGHPACCLEDRVTRAAHRYHQKHDRWPNTCYVNPADHNGVAAVTIGTRVIRVLPAANCLRSHYWIGETEIQHSNGGER